MILSAAFVRPGFATISHDDHAGYLWIVTILGALYSFLVAVVRFYIKFQILGLDDYLLGLATVSSTPCLVQNRVKSTAYSDHYTLL